MPEPNSVLLANPQKGASRSSSSNEAAPQGPVRLADLRRQLAGVNYQAGRAQLAVNPRLGSVSAQIIERVRRNLTISPTFGGWSPAKQQAFVRWAFKGPGAFSDALLGRPEVMQIFEQHILPYDKDPTRTDLPIIDSQDMYTTATGRPGALNFGSPRGQHPGLGGGGMPTLTIPSQREGRRGSHGQPLVGFGTSGRQLSHQAPWFVGGQGDRRATPNRTTLAWAPHSGAQAPSRRTWVPGGIDGTHTDVPSDRRLSQVLLSEDREVSDEAYGVQVGQYPRYAQGGTSTHPLDLFRQGGQHMQQPPGWRRDLRSVFERAPSRVDGGQPILPSTSGPRLVRPGTSTTQGHAYGFPLASPTLGRRGFPAIPTQKLETDVAVTAVFKMWVPRLLEYACKGYEEHVTEEQWRRTDSRGQRMLEEEGGKKIQSYLGPFLEAREPPPMEALTPLISGPLHKCALVRQVLSNYFGEAYTRRVGAEYYRKYKRPPWPMVSQSDETKMIGQLPRCRSLLEEWEISDNEIEPILEMANGWIACDRSEGTDTAHLDRFLTFTKMRQVKYSMLGSTMLLYDAIYFYAHHEGSAELRSRWDRIIQSSSRYSRDAGMVPETPPNIWDDVVVMSAKGLPGGITAFAGGAAQSLPFGVGDGLGGYLKESAREYLHCVGYDEKLADDVIDAEEFVGQMWGEGAQMVLGAGVAAKAAKYADTADKLEDVTSFGIAVTQWFQKNIGTIKLAGKIFTDLINDLSQQPYKEDGEGLDAGRAISIAINRVNKEILSKMGEEALGKGETQLDNYRTQRDNERRHAGSASGLQSTDRSKRRQQGKRPTNGQKRNNKNRRKQIDALKNKSGMSASRKQAALAAFIAKTALRRFLVEMVNTYVKTLSAHKGNASEAVADIQANFSKHVGRCVTGVVREVIRDSIFQVYFGEMDNKFKKAIVEHAMDGITKMIRAHLHELFDYATGGDSKGLEGYEGS